ncbi:Extracellular serine/threonine protein kinase four-jointed [Amphibalanus amphitrite]|uniref:Extracellular serine/threonine protein kinase four-jointed n=1 Tax=Amphibalanus amphitrite TaxID=1232801 RepID=A0A6A4WNE8_AMPAM|nr:Extracellular serine/threonine protein kinase four-jointed [Amphibalanus amphitrite]
MGEESPPRAAGSRPPSRPAAAAAAATGTVGPQPPRREEARTDAPRRAHACVTAAMHKLEVLGVRVAPTRTAQALCVIAAGVAFVLGTVLGVLIPLYVLPPLYSETDAGVTPPTAAPSAAGLLTALGRRPPLVTPRPTELPVELVDSISYLGAAVSEDSESVLSSLVSTESSPVAGLQRTSARPAVVVNASVEEEESDVAELTDGIFWSDAVEAALPRGVASGEVTEWRAFCRRAALIKVEEGCGRMQNRLLTFENGTQSCCRYRQNFDQIQGEIFSFLLSRELGIRNLPPTSLLLVQPAERQWSAVRAQLSLAQWAEQRPVVLTRFRENLTPAFIPEQLRGTDRRLHPADLRLSGLNMEQNRDTVLELAQWSDLILFDYLTANLDRIVNNLYNQQWNPSMMDSPAHNLARDPSTGLLMFLDNESGLLHGYRLLDKYEPYHRTMLDATCVFRRDTVEAIRRLHRAGDVGTALRRIFRETHPELVDFLPTLPEKSIKILKKRIDNVHEVIERCERTYAS